MSLQRMDMMRVTTDDGHTWDRMDGGAATTEGFEEVRLEVGRGAHDAHYIVNLCRRVHGHIAVLVTAMDDDMKVGQSYGVGGELVRVDLSAYDADVSNDAVDAIVIQPDKVVPL